ncbi:MAG: outer membrane beta-barrel protein [Bacteroidota bacterium]
MKNGIWFYFLIFLLNITTLSAQPIVQTLTAGVRLGTNAATLRGDTYSNLGFRTSIVLGFFAEQELTSSYSARVEVNYSAEGARNRNYDFSDFSTVIYDQILKYNYLQFPLLLQKQVADRLELHGGTQLGLRLAAKEVRTIQSGEPSPSDRSEGTRGFNSRIKYIFPSVIFGGEYLLNDRLAAQARFQFSYVDNVKRTAGDSEGTYPFIFQIALSCVLKQE